MAAIISTTVPIREYCSGETSLNRNMLHLNPLQSIKRLTTKIHSTFVNCVIQKSVTITNSIYLSALVFYEAHNFSLITLSQATNLILQKVFVLASAISSVFCAIIEGINIKEAVDFSHNPLLDFYNLDCHNERTQTQMNYTEWVQKHKKTLENITIYTEDTDANKINLHEYLLNITKSNPIDESKKAIFYCVLFKHLYQKYTKTTGKDLENQPIKSLTKILQGEIFTDMQEINTKLDSYSNSAEIKPIKNFCSSLKTQITKRKFFSTLALAAIITTLVGAILTFLFISYPIAIPTTLAISLWWGGWGAHTLINTIAKGILNKKNGFSIYRALVPSFN